MRYLLYFIISLAAQNVSSQTVLPSFSAVYNKAEDWSPSDESSLIAWWDASDISTLTGDPVTQMTSKKGTFTLQSIAGNSSSNPPDRTTINSLNALDFDMSSNEKLLTSQSNFNINDGNMIIVGAVVIEGVNNQKDAIWSIRDDNAPNNDIHLRAGNGSQFDGAFETEKLGSSGADLSGGFSRSFVGGPFSDNIIHASITCR